MGTVSNYTAILGESYWSGAGAVQDRPAFVTYSFDDFAAPYLTNADLSKSFRESFIGFTEAEKDVARAALAQWADASGLVFLEVGAGKGDIRFGTYDFQLDPGTNQYSGFGFFPDTDVDKYYAYRTDLGGDVFIDHGEAGDMYLLLHEIGHALGFKHPFEGDPKLVSWLDNHNNTIMSYTGSYPDTLGRFDLEAVKTIYGNSNTDGTQVASWSWKSSAERLVQTGFENHDTIYGVAVTDVINGRGGNDWIAGFQGRDTLKGGDGADRIFGGEDNDRLRGGAGRDYLEGNDGNDRFEFTRLSDDRDIIGEFSNSAGNNDRLYFKASAFGDLGRAADGTGVILSRYLQASPEAEAQTANARFIYDTETGVLRFDADGTGPEAAVLIARLWGIPELTNDDFVIF